MSHQERSFFFPVHRCSFFPHHQHDSRRVINRFGEEALEVCEFVGRPVEPPSEYEDEDEDEEFEEFTEDEEESEETYADFE